MEGFILALIIIGIIVFLLALFVIGVYNALVKLRNIVKDQWAQIDVLLKRRADLIPNLVSTVKGLTAQEQKLVDSVTSARAKMATGTTQDKLNANTELTKSLNILVENYPVLKSDTAFVSLMDEIAGSENRVAVARKAYNDEVGLFNAKIRTFPTKIIASMSGFTAKSYLEVSTEDKNVPEVKF